MSPTKNSAADHIGGNRWRMAGHMQDVGIQAADGKAVAVIKEALETRSIAEECDAYVERVAEHGLHRVIDPLTSIAPPTISCKCFVPREVLGVDMGFEQPVNGNVSVRSVFQCMGLDK